MQMCIACSDRVPLTHAASMSCVERVSVQAAQAQLHGGALEKAQQDAIVAKAAAAEALRAAHAERDAALVQAGSADRRAVQLEAELSDAKVRLLSRRADACCRAKSRQKHSELCCDLLIAMP